MKVDLYTKSILTVIAVAMVAPVTHNITTPAEAQFGGGSEIFVSRMDGHGVWQLKGGKVRYCIDNRCGVWLR